MKITKRKVEKRLIILLLTFILLTYLEVYYVPYIPLVIFVLCYFISPKYHGAVNNFIIGGILVFAVFMFISFINGESLGVDYISIFMHYLIWPVLLVFTIQMNDTTFIKKVLWITIVICLVGDISSLVQLNRNPEILRSMAGAIGKEQFLDYSKLGVAGYGYLYSMVFLTYGVIRWIKDYSSKFEKVMLILFLIVNSIFILKAQYTIAILLMIILSIIALVLNKKNNKNNIKLIVLLGIVLFGALFGKSILESLVAVVNELKLPWVSTRLSQLLDVTESPNNIFFLARYELYLRSLKAFVENPLLGGGIPGGHSEIFDAMASFGISGILLVVFFRSCIIKCCMLVHDKTLIVMYITFIIFACINNCAAKQLPCILFYIIPLISYTVRRKNENSTIKCNLRTG